MDCQEHGGDHHHVEFLRLLKVDGLAWLFERVDFGCGANLSLSICSPGFELACITLSLFFSLAHSLCLPSLSLSLSFSRSLARSLSLSLWLELLDQKWRGKHSGHVAARQLQAYCMRILMLSPSIKALFVSIAPHLAAIQLQHLQTCLAGKVWKGQQRQEVARLGVCCSFLNAVVLELSLSVFTLMTAFFITCRGLKVTAL